MDNKIIVIGAGGHSREVISTVESEGKYEIVGLVDDKILDKNEKILGYDVIGNFGALSKLYKEGIKKVVLAIGDNTDRRRLFEMAEQLNFEVINAIHPSAKLARHLEIGKGVVICIGAILSPCAKIGNNTIINVGAIIGHENIIGNHVHISSGANLAGRITVKDGAFVGIGSTIKETVTIGKNAIVGAGAVVLDDVQDDTIVVGLPARPIKRVNK